MRPKRIGPMELARRQKVAEFWTQVEKSPDCWQWRGEKSVVQYLGKTYKPRRLAYLLLNGTEPEDQLWGTCDNADCINPSHCTPRKELAETGLASRFWKKVDRSGDCWLWTAARYSNGYGAIRWKGRTVHATRVGWELAHGPIPDGLFVLHRCDNPPCVRPDHLFLGTAADNTEDMARKGRGRYVPLRGEDSPRAKLKEEDVRAIRRLHAEGVTCYRLAKNYGRHITLIIKIVRRELWKHIL